MHPIFTSIAIAGPETVLTLGSLAALMLGTFSAKGKALTVTSLFAVAILALAGFTLLDAPAGMTRAFDGLYVADDFSAFLKVIILAASAASVLLALPWDTAGLSVMPLFDDPFFLVFRPGDLPDPPPAVAPDAIDPHHLLLLEDGHCLKEQVLSACGRPELRADPAHRGTSLVTLVEMVAGGLGQTLVPKLALDAGILTHGNLIARPVSGNAARTVSLVWRHGSPREAEFRLMGESLVAGLALS